MSGTPVTTHGSCPDEWLAQFNLTRVHKGGLKHSGGAGGIAPPRTKYINYEQNNYFQLEIAASVKVPPRVAPAIHKVMEPHIRINVMKDGR
jgi:hypothetical protein